MENQEFLSQFIRSLDFIESAVSELILAVKDVNSNILYSTKGHTEVIGLNSQEIIGRHALPGAEGAYDPKQSLLEDQMIMQTRKNSNFLKINHYQGRLIPLIMSKSVIINPTTDQVVGLFCHFKKLHVFSFSHEILKSFAFYKKKCSLSDSKIKLSKREKQVIFLFLAKLGSQEIAEALCQMEGKKVSKSTIDSVFNDQLFIKFEVHSRIALFDKLMGLGFDKLLPAEMLIDISIPLSDLETY